MSSLVKIIYLRNKNGIHFVPLPRQELILILILILFMFSFTTN